MKTVKYGIIGVGNMGSGHLKLFMDGGVEGAVVTAIADLSELKRNKVKETYRDSKFSYYESGEELIEKADVDAVVVAVPHYDHPKLVIQALKSVGWWNWLCHWWCISNCNWNFLAWLWTFWMGNWWNCHYCRSREYCFWNSRNTRTFHRKQLDSRFFWLER